MNNPSAPPSHANKSYVENFSRFVLSFDYRNIKFPKMNVVPLVDNHYGNRGILSRHCIL